MLKKLGSGKIAAVIAAILVLSVVTASPGLAKKHKHSSGGSSSGMTGPQGPAGATGNTGATGLQGPAGTARAYAYVDRNSTFDTTRTSGFTAVSRVATGTYCLTPASGISPDNRPAVTSVDWYATVSPQGDATAMTSRSNFYCPDQFEVHTQRKTGGNAAAPANDVAFTIIVP